MSNFQIIVISVFGLFIFVAVLIFSGLVPGLKMGGDSDVSGAVVLWGTVPATSIAPIIDDFNLKYKPISVTYVEKNRSVFDRDLTEALASGLGPDLIMLPRGLIYRHSDKIYPIAYSTLSERDFKDTFVEEGEIFLTAQGILALPLRIDPMVMYFNRDSLTNSGISLPPKTWEELLAMTPELVEKDSSGNVVKSAVSFGEFVNVNYAKDIISLLTLQAGNKIVQRADSGLKSVFGDTSSQSLRPADEAVRYYANFSNPVTSSYSWSKSQPNSRDAFLSGTLAFYFGYASELFGIRERNPHLNFDVTAVPQVKGASAKITIGEIEGLAALRGSKNLSAALRVESLMTDQEYALKLAKQTFLPPARRDILGSKPGDAYMNVFFESALMSRGWIDPSPVETSAIFKELIENVVSGRLRINDAVTNADGELAKLLNKN
ncbi:MAG: extracellular solute-binding protein [Candidatus Paceibacterota bacterium]|jgi:ABC-type glycerol-3-phosphate transport system substrate-binding protein